MPIERFLAPLFAFALLVGCSTGADRAAQTADRTLEGGIGGTGSQVAQGEGGIGGTGAPIRAGAVGTVTGFGSVHLNGLRVVFPETASLNSVDGTMTESQLGLGDTLEIIGQLGDDGTIRAERSLVRHAVIGQIRSISLDGQKLNVLGTDVFVEPGAPVVDASGQQVVLRLGDRIAVSGLPKGGVVIASRVERLEPIGRSSVYGIVSGVNGLPSINGVQLRKGPVDALLPGGVPMSVSGIERDGRLVYDRVERGLIFSLAAPLPQIAVEGYLEPSAASPTGFAIEGFGQPLDAGARVSVLSGDRAVFIGSLEGGEFRVRHGLPLPDETNARREKLEAVTNGFAPVGALPTR